MKLVHGLWSITFYSLLPFLDLGRDWLIFWPSDNMDSFVWILTNLPLFLTSYLLLMALYMPNLTLISSPQTCSCYAIYLVYQAVKLTLNIVSSVSTWEPRGAKDGTALAHPSTVMVCIWCSALLQGLHHTNLKSFFQPKVDLVPQNIYFHCMSRWTATSPSWKAKCIGRMRFYK